MWTFTSDWQAVAGVYFEATADGIGRCGQVVLADSGRCLNLDVFKLQVNGLPIHSKAATTGSRMASKASDAEANEEDEWWAA